MSYPFTVNCNGATCWPEFFIDEMERIQEKKPNKSEEMFTSIKESKDLDKKLGQKLSDLARSVLFKLANELKETKAKKNLFDQKIFQEKMTGAFTSLYDQLKEFVKSDQEAIKAVMLVSSYLWVNCFRKDCFYDFSPKKIPENVPFSSEEKSSEKPSFERASTAPLP